MDLRQEGNMPDFEELETRLRANRHQATALELDQIKQRAMARASHSRTRGAPLRARLIAMLAVLGLMGAGTGGVIAAAGGNGNGNSAAKSEYRPGNGCGDKNHIHYGPPGQGATPENPKVNCPN
jgi:hypothetical protein